jgi:hypothetical protein
MSDFDVEKLLKALDNEDNADVMQLNYEQISKEKNDILQNLKQPREKLKELNKKLKDYRYVDSIESLKYGTHIRWISLKNPDPLSIKLTNGGIIVKIEVNKDDIYIMVKNNMNYFITIKMSENLIFQKLMNQEQILLTAIKYLNK